MAQFPALIPSAAPITPGAWPVTAASSLNGAESRVRHGSAEIGRRLRLQFANVSEADFLSIVAHYRGQRSGFDSFGFATTTLAADLTPAGFAWLYAGPPQVVDDHADCFTVTCEFRCEPRGLVVAPGRRWRSTTTLTPGERTDGVSRAAGKAWVSAAGAWVPGMGRDPYFSQVSLLLHMDGTNGSTTFTDSSSNAHAMYVNDGTVTITTANSKFGGSSADFTAGGDLRTPSSVTFTFPGDFTIEFWAKRTGLLNGSATLLSAEWKPGNDQWLMIRPKETYSGETFWINDQGFAYNFTLTPDTWQHLAMVRSGSIVTAYVDGSSIGTVTENGTVTSGYLVFGDSSAASGRYFKGLIDEVRVTKGVARYTSNFTPSASPFPDY